MTTKPGEISVVASGESSVAPDLAIVSLSVTADGKQLSPTRDDVNRRAATVSGGGVGGLFIPLVVTGAVLGRAMGAILPGLDEQLAVIIGVASVLGGGYRVPLAAVVFVAEATGRPGFIVPALLAAVAAELVMGRRSVTSYQRRPPSWLTMRLPSSVPT